ncbi:hypothetical protein SOVF_214880 [Spinacia oleracea]|nr:hypothetical protein SOVF_214880 [Spinacia oleracea]
MPRDTISAIFFIFLILFSLNTSISSLSIWGSDFIGNLILHCFRNC